MPTPARHLARSLALLLLLLLALPLTACAGRDKSGLRGTRAVVIYTRNRTAGAASARQILEREGMYVEVQVAGPMSPESSVLIVNDGIQYPERAQRLHALLTERVGELEMSVRGIREEGGPAAVLWLVDDER